MKIIHLVLGKANPDRLNGINRIVHNLALAMHDRGLDTEIWGITPDPSATTIERPYPLRLFARASWSFAPPPGLTREVRALVASGHDAIFHLHGALLPHFHAVVRVLNRFEIPYVLTPHGSYTVCALKRNRIAKKAYIALFDKSVLQGARAVQVNSQIEADELAARVNGVNIVIAPNGQSDEEVRFNRRELDRPERPVIGFCGRLDTEHKGLDLLIEGFARYRDAGGTGALWLIGDGPEREDLESLVASRDLEGRVLFFGALFGEEKCNRLAHADAFVHSSRHEGMPMSVLEAGALGLPLLVSRGTNLAEDVERHEAGLVIEPNTSERIADVLRDVEELMCADQLSLLGMNAKRMIEAEFSWDSVAMRIAREAYGIDPYSVASRRDVA